MDYTKLRNYIKGQGMTYKEYAEKVLNTSATNVDYKFRNKQEFTRKQIELTMKYFNLSNKQVIDFFFCE